MVSLSSMSSINCLLLVLLTVISHDVSSSDDIVIPPTIVSARNVTPTEYSEGSTKKIELTCEASGSWPLTVEWWRVGLQSTVVENSGRLLLEPTTESQGFYQCRANNAAGTAISRVIPVQRYYIVKETIHLDSKFEFKGNSAIIHCPCIFRSHPPAVIQWRDAERKLVDEGDIVEFTDPGDLILTDLNYKSDQMDYDATKWQCHGTNEVLRKTLYCDEVPFVKPVNSTVNSRNQLIYKSESIHVAAGSTARLKCVFSGRSNITWRRANGLPISGSFSNFGRRLTIAATTPEDLGTYRCETSENVGLIDVKVGKAPEITRHLISQNVTMNHTVTLECGADGEPAPHIAWYFNGELYNNTWTIGKERSIAYGISSQRYNITFDKVQRSLSVSCNVSNLHGHSMSTAYVALLPVKRATEDKKGDSTWPVADIHTDVISKTTAGSSADSSMQKMPETTIIAIAALSVAVILTVLVVVAIVTVIRNRTRRHDKMPDKQVEPDGDDSTSGMRTPLSSIHEMGSQDSGIDEVANDGDMPDIAGAENFQNDEKEKERLQREIDMDSDDNS